MTTIEEKFREQPLATESLPQKESLRAPVFNPREVYGEYRFNRMIKFVLIGVGVGMIVGVAVGGLLASNLDVAVTAKAALTASIGLAGGTIGAVAGIIVENSTAPSLSS